MKFIEQILAKDLWILQAALVLAMTFAVQLITSFAVHKVSNKVKQKGLLFPEALLHAIKVPLVCLIWLLGIVVACMFCLPEQEDLTLVNYIVDIKKAGVIILLTWALIRFIRAVEALTLQKKKRSAKVDATMVHALAMLSNVLAILIGTMTTMQILGLPISGLLAFGGIGGAAIAFASKDLLTNFFGGLVVYLDKPFKVGDRICSPDKPIDGIVEYIGWRVTRVRTLDKRALYVPNSFFLTICVENASRMLNRRIKTMVGVRYQDVSKVEAITNDIYNMLQSHPAVDTKLFTSACLAEFGPSSLNILIDCFTTVTALTEYRTATHDIYLKVLDIITSNGAECAFPTQTVFLEQHHASE